MSNDLYSSLNFKNNVSINESKLFSFGNDVFNNNNNNNNNNFADNYMIALKKELNEKYNNKYTATSDLNNLNYSLKDKEFNMYLSKEKDLLKKSVESKEYNTLFNSNNLINDI